MFFLYAVGCGGYKERCKEVCVRNAWFKLDLR